MQHTQTQNPIDYGVLGLLVLETSPYFSIGRGVLIEKDMLLKAFIANYSIAGNNLDVTVFFKSDDGTITAGTSINVGVSYSDTDVTIQANIATAINTFCSNNSLPAPIIDWLVTTPTDLAAAIAASTPAVAVINTATRSIVTGTGATGFQVSATRNVFASYSVTIATTATIGGSASGSIVLEVAATNSATAGDWVEVARFTNGQAITLAIALQSVQTLAGQVNGMIPAGYYAKIRSINNSGTPTYTFNSGREILQ